MRHGTPAILGGPPAVRTSQRYAWPMVTADMESAVLTALRGGRLVYGEESPVALFEAEFAAFHGSRFSLGTNSGTCALLAAFYGCGLGSISPESRLDQEVIVPAYGFFATVSPLLHLGVRPVFCDVDAETGNLDPARVREAIGPHTAGIAVTHYAGHPAELDELAEIARESAIPLIEDASHAHGSLYRGRRVGTFGTAAAFSLQAGKLLCAGEGGVVLSDREDVFVRACALANARRLSTAGVLDRTGLRDTGLGLKLRLGPLEAALARHHLKHLDALIEARRSNLAALGAGLQRVAGEWVAAPRTRAHVTRGAHYEFPLRYRAEERLPLHAFCAALQAEGVQLARSNSRAVQHLPLLASGLARAERALAGESLEAARGAAMPVADELERTTFFLPTFTGPADEVIEQYPRAFEKVGAALPRLLEDLHRHPARYHGPALAAPLPGSAPLSSSNCV